MNLPKVTCIVPHHLNENDEYLKWCLRSITASVNANIEVICISDAEKPPNVECDPYILFIYDPTLNNATKKWHHGIKLARKDSKYIMLISDDVMVSKHTIAELANTIGDYAMIMGPASNCDANTRFHTQFKLTNGFDEITVNQKETLENIKGFEQGVLEYPLSKRILIDLPWISFYCTMFPRVVLEALGDFDPALDCRWNDVDYCARAKDAGVGIIINLGCFALHFGDRTLPKSTTPEMYREADLAYINKYKGNKDAPILVPEDHGDLL